VVEIEPGSMNVSAQAGDRKGQCHKIVASITPHHECTTFPPLLFLHRRSFYCLRGYGGIVLNRIY